jgi:hypothetical protein
VWTRWAGLDLVVRIGASTVTIVGRDGTLVHHPRKRFGERSIDYRHYLAELARKPQAVRQVLPDLLRDLGAPFPAIWDQLHGAHGPRDAARLFAKVLGQLETQGAVVVVPALTAALATGTPLLLALTPARASIDRLDRTRCPRLSAPSTSGAAVRPTTTPGSGRWRYERGRDSRSRRRANPCPQAAGYRPDV